MKKKRLGGKSRAGRLMKRLLGDTAGGVLMEYVVLGLLIVAAVAVAVIGFGDDIRKALGGMGKVALGDVTGAEADLTKARGENKTAIEAGQTYSDKIGVDK